MFSLGHVSAWSLRKLSGRSLGHILATTDARQPKTVNQHTRDRDLKLFDDEPKPPLP